MMTGGFVVTAQELKEKESRTEAYDVSHNN